MKKGKLTNWLKSFDIFGSSVGFTVKNGDSTYKTCAGFIVTISIYLLVIIYGSTKFNAMWQIEDTNF